MRNREVSPFIEIRSIRASRGSGSPTTTFFLEYIQRNKEGDVMSGSPKKAASAKRVAPAVKKAPAKKVVPAKKVATKKDSPVEKASKAAQSKYFRTATDRARKIVGDPQKLRDIADKASRSSATRSGPFAAVLDDFRALIRLVVAYARGHYRDIPADALIPVIAGLIYVVSPIDLIPDAIPGVGLLDDAAVVGWVLKTVRGELDSFRAWEEGSQD